MMRRRALSLLVFTAAAVVIASTAAFAAVINGNVGNNTLRGTDRADRIDGRAGNDTLRARRGSDRLTGGQDEDALSGQGGRDRYLFANGNWGNDRIPSAGEASGRDTLDFSALSSGLNVRLVASAGQPEVASQVSPSTLNFPTTVVIEDASGGAGGDNISGSDRANRLSGNDGADFLDGADGNDALFAGPGDDFLRGLVGDDALNGGEGDDIYLFGVGWGQDTIAAGEISGDDEVRFFNGSAPVAVDLAPDATGPEVGSGADPAHTLEFPSGVVIENAETNRGNDYLYGNEAGNKLIGGLGSDEVRGRGGADVLRADETSLAGPGAFGTGNDIMYGDAGDDTMYGHDSGCSNTCGADVMLGGPDADTMHGFYNADTMNGEGGNDTMYGDRDDDQMAGGPGTDTVYGDTPSIPTNSGNDTIDVSDSDGGDTVDCGPGTGDTVYVDSIRNPFGTGRIPIDQTTNCETRNLQ